MDVGKDIDEQSSDPVRPARNMRPGFGALIAIGVGGGIALGSAFGEIGVGVVLGLSVATLVNALLEWREGAPRAGVAVAIGVVGVIAVLAILVWL